MKSVVLCSIILFGLTVLYPVNAFCGRVAVCYGYNCKKTAIVQVSEIQEQELGQLFFYVKDAETEREAIGKAVLNLHLIAAEQTPIYQDKGGNFKDGTYEGKMDCIDHSETNTYFLNYLSKLDLIRFHRVLKPYYRAPRILDLHYASRIEEISSSRQWVIDTWFYDFGHPPVIIDAKQWRKGWYPEDWKSIFPLPAR